MFTRPRRPDLAGDRLIRLLRRARRSAGLTQRSLARRSKIPQPTIAAIETGRQDPRFETLRSLVESCGRDVATVQRPGHGVDRTQIRELLRLTPGQRLRLAAEDARGLERLLRAAKTMSDRGFDPVAALQILVAHSVDLVVIGGIAGRLWGSAMITRDLGICYARAPANLERLAAALQQVHARLRGVKEEVPFCLDARTLGAGDSFTFTSDVGDLACLGTPTGTGGYDDLKADAEQMDVDGLKVSVTSLADLMDMKRAAGRNKDLQALENLGALRDERERRRR